MKASYIMLNILFAFGLFFLNALLGRIQYGLSGKLFQYGKFTFADAEQQNFSGNFFQKIVNPAVYLAGDCRSDADLPASRVYPVALVACPTVLDYPAGLYGS